MQKTSIYNARVKPLLDKCFAVALIIVLSPLTITVVSILFFTYGQVFFVQPRVGRHGHDFKMLKFRTMDNEGRILLVGKLLRRLSIDELPQLINVLKGEMSLVGPRPLFKEYLPHYTSEQLQRHTVQPGITGWAQVRGRNALPWEERLALDVEYVRKQSFWLDLKILFMTVIRLFDWRSADFHSNAFPKFNEQHV